MQYFSDGLEAMVFVDGGEERVDAMPECLFQPRIVFQNTLKNLLGGIAHLQNNVAVDQPKFEALVLPDLLPHQHLAYVLDHSIRLIGYYLFAVVVLLYEKD